MIVGVFLVADLGMLFMNRNRIQEFSGHTLIWHLAGLTSVVIPGLLFNFGNIIIHDSFFKLKLPTYVIMFNWLIAALNVLLLPFYSMKRHLQDFSNPNYGCDYEKKSLSYIIYALVLGVILDCICFGGSTNLLFLYITVGALVIYFSIMLIMGTKLSNKYKVIVSGE